MTLPSPAPVPPMRTERRSDDFAQTPHAARTRLDVNGRRRAVDHVGGVLTEQRRQTLFQIFPQTGLHRTRTGHATASTATALRLPLALHLRSLPRLDQVDRDRLLDRVANAQEVAVPLVGEIQTLQQCFERLLDRRSLDVERAVDGLNIRLDDEIDVRVLEERQQHIADRRLSRLQRIHRTPDRLPRLLQLRQRHDEHRLVDGRRRALLMIEARR